MATIEELNTERTELNTAIDGYQAAVAGGDPTAKDTAKATAASEGKDFANKITALKRQDPALTLSQLVSNPTMMTQAKVDDIGSIVRKGSLIKEMKALMKGTLQNGVYKCNICFSATATKPANITVDWGDGTIETHTTTSTTLVDRVHTYPDAGTYAVKITGYVNRIKLAKSTTSPNHLVDLTQWGNSLEIEAYDSMFRGMQDFAISAPDKPMFKVGTDLTSMFHQANTFNSDISHWDTSNVVSMNFMFMEATAFNQPLNSWNVSNVTAMQYLFLRAYAFNQPLNNWNTGMVTNMQQMFYHAAAFNQGIRMWDVSSVTSESANFRTNSALSAANSPFGWYMELRLFAALYASVVLNMLEFVLVVCLFLQGPSIHLFMALLVVLIVDGCLHLSLLSALRLAGIDPDTTCRIWHPLVCIDYYKMIKRYRGYK